MSATVTARNSRTCGPELAPLLLLLGAGLGLWLISLTAGFAGRPADATVHRYQWRDEPDRPAGIYRLPPPAGETAGPPGEEWARQGPPYLAIFTFDPIAINRAEARTLTFLPGIGPVLSQRLVDYRDNHGPFQDSEELLEVHGIGPKTLSDLRPLIIID